MGKIIYNEETLLDAKNRIDSCNDQILSALEKINLEFINMDETLSTPKSSKAMPIFVDYYHNKIVLCLIFFLLYLNLIFFSHLFLSFYKN